MVNGVPMITGAGLVGGRQRSEHLLSVGRVLDTLYTLAHLIMRLALPGSMCSKRISCFAFSSALQK